MKRLFSFLLIIISILCLASCGTSDPSGSPTPATQEQSSSGITALKFSVEKSPIALDAGKSEKGYFKVSGNDDFSLDDIEFVSSDPSVASFEYDSTALKTCVYYKINGLKAGSTTVYVQTKDGSVKTSEIEVTVSGYLYKIEDFDDISVGGTKRVILRTTLDEDYYLAMTEDEVTALVKYITEKYAASHKMNAIAVYLFFTGDDVSNGDFIIAQSTYAPKGDIAKAPDVAAGDYSTFDYDITIYSEAERTARRG